MARKYRSMITIPFPGNKKSSYKRIKAIFTGGGYTNVVEPFGGSCVLSVNLKREGLAESAYINDYDGIFEIYPEFLDIKDWIVNEMFDHGIYGTVASGRTGVFRKDNRDGTLRHKVNSRCLNQEEREFLQSLIVQVDKKYWRLLTLGCNFTHSGVSQHKDIYLKDFAYFNGLLTTTKAREYLKFVETCTVDTLDWRDFCDKYLPQAGPEKTLVILDPPYFGTESFGYGGDMDEEETMDILRYMRESGADFVFFNSDDDWIGAALEDVGFDNYTIERIGVVNNTINHTRREYVAYVRGGLHGCD